MNVKDHWETVYKSKTPDQVSWTREKPEISLRLIRETNLPKTAKIIDIGGGDSTLVDYLLDEGYQDISVLDISGRAIERAKLRLGERANEVQWIVSDITAFKPERNYDIWHDRAAFHFLTTEEHIDDYRNIASNAVSEFLIIGTFSKLGPLKCSGLEISQYDSESLLKIFDQNFELNSSFTSDHLTPFQTLQNFLFCSFKKLK